MQDQRITIKKPFLSGTTRRIQFQIINEETGEGFQPTTVTMSVYDVVSSSVANATATMAAGRWTWPCGCLHVSGTPVQATGTVLVSSTIINDQNDVDVSGFVDSLGNVDLYLTVDDTGIDDVPEILRTTPHQRRVLFTWTWDTPEKTEKLEIILHIVPDREAVAS